MEFQGDTQRSHERFWGFYGVPGGLRGIPGDPRSFQGIPEFHGISGAFQEISSFNLLTFWTIIIHS